MTSAGPASPSSPAVPPLRPGPVGLNSDASGGRMPDDQPVPDQALRGPAEEGGRHVEGQPQEERAEDHPAGADLDLVMVVVGPEEAEQVEAADGRQGDPGRQDHVGVEPGVLGRDVAELGGVEELERRADLDQAADHLDRVHPVAAAGHLREQARAQGQQEERERQHRREGGQADDRVEEVPARRHHEQAADDRERAGERGDRQRQRHEDHADQAAAALALGRGVEQEVGQADLEEPQQAQAEGHEEGRDDQVQPRVVGQVLEERGREEEREEDADRREDADDRQAVRDRQARSSSLALAALPLLDEEVDRDRDHRPDAGHHQREEPAQGRGEQEGDQALLGPPGDLAHRSGGWRAWMSSRPASRWS